MNEARNIICDMGWDRRVEDLVWGGKINTKLFKKPYGKLLL